MGAGNGQRPGDALRRPRPLPSPTRQAPRSARAGPALGEIETDAATQHVDQSYTGGDSNGSATQPWTTIQAAVDAAASGATVAITDGTYPEAVEIDGKPVVLWGRCPERVEVDSPEGSFATVQLSQVDGVVLRGLGVTGDQLGIALSGARGVLVEHCWIHALPTRGVDAEAPMGPAELTVRRCLIERVGGYGIFASGSEVVADQCLIRCVTQDAYPGSPTGICAQLSSSDPPPRPR